jgi:hypothetical protein
MGLRGGVGSRSFLGLPRGRWIFGSLGGTFLGLPTFLISLGLPNFFLGRGLSGTCKCFLIGRDPCSLTGTASLVVKYFGSKTVAASSVVSKFLNFFRGRPRFLCGVASEADVSASCDSESVATSVADFVSLPSCPLEAPGSLSSVVANLLLGLLLR